MDIDPIIRPTSISNIAFERIRQSILSGKMKPDKIYKEMEIADQMKVSRTPVREALRQLAVEGLVTAMPGRGYIVNRFSARDIKEIYDLRTALEVAIVKKIAQNPDKYNFSESDRLNLALCNSLKKEKYDQFVHVDRQYHTEFCRLYGNARIEAALEKSRDVFQLFLSDFKVMALGRGNEIVSEHQKINDCLKSGNVAGVIEAMETHLYNSLAAVLEILRSNESLLGD